jgi:hypothetical protein
LKSKHVIVLLASIILILIMVATSCTPATGPAVTVTVTPPTVTVTATPTSATAKEKTFRALNPAGIFIPVQTKPLAARIDTIEGKTIYVCQGEADPVIMPALYKRLVKDYTKTKWIYYDRSDFGPNVPGTGGSSSSTNLPEDPDILKKVQAVIRGNGW